MRALSCRRRRAVVRIGHRRVACARLRQGEHATRRGDEAKQQEEVLLEGGVRGAGAAARG
eukprot:1548844-Pleurochrysis_carterae.AAC.5